MQERATKARFAKERLFCREKRSNMGGFQKVVEASGEEESLPASEIEQHFKTASYVEDALPSECFLKTHMQSSASITDAACRSASAPAFLHLHSPSLRSLRFLHSQFQE